MLNLNIIQFKYHILIIIWRAIHFSDSRLFINLPTVLYLVSVFLGNKKVFGSIHILLLYPSFIRVVYWFTVCIKIIMLINIAFSYWKKEDFPKTSEAHYKCRVMTFNGWPRKAQISKNVIIWNSMGIPAPNQAQGYILFYHLSGMVLDCPLRAYRGG